VKVKTHAAYWCKAALATIVLKCTAASFLQAAPLALQQPHKPLNTSAAAVDELIAALSTDPKLAEAFVRTR
jgi:hypothetical protein